MEIIYVVFHTGIIVPIFKNTNTAYVCSKILEDQSSRVVNAYSYAPQSR